LKPDHQNTSWHCFAWVLISFEGVYTKLKGIILNSEKLK